MPFRDGRTAPGFGTPIRRQNRSSLRNLFQNRHRNTAFPRVYFSDQLFQAAETKNPQPVEWMYQGAFLTKGLEKVRAEFSLTALAYNLRRAINI